MEVTEKDELNKNMYTNGMRLLNECVCGRLKGNQANDDFGQGFVFKKYCTNQEVPILSFAPTKKVEMAGEALNPIVEIDYSYAHNGELYKPDKWGRVQLFDRGEYIELQATVVTHLTKGSQDTSFIVTMRLPAYVITELRQSAA